MNLIKQLGLRLKKNVKFITKCWSQMLLKVSVYINVPSYLKWSAIGCQATVHLFYILNSREIHIAVCY